MIFGKSKDELLKSTQSEVFDIMRVGANISKYRKASGMTQTELSDRLGLSFQAVSNWERGQSCPDIANLMALAEMFGVSVDKLLGSERAAKLVEEIHEEKTPEMSAEEIKELAPILKEEQADGVVLKNLADESGNISPQSIAEVAPYVSEELVKESAENTLMELGDIPDDLLAYLSEDFIGEIAKKLYRDGGIDAVPERYLPYIDEDIIGEMAADAIKNGGFGAIPQKLLGYIDEDDLGAATKEVFRREGFEAIPESILGYLDEDDIGEMVKEAYKKGGLAAIPRNIWGYVDEDDVNDIAVEILKKDGIKGIKPIIDYVDSDVIEDFIRRKMNM